MLINKIIYIIKLFIGIIAIFIIPLSFILLPQIENNLDKILKLQVTPSMIGGTILTEIYDQIDDDYGYGNLTYPKNKLFDTPHTLDLIKYTVRKPLTDAVWNKYKYFWQIELTFQNIKFKNKFEENFLNPVISIYIDIDGNKSGKIETYFPRAELIKFDKNHPWDIYIHINCFENYGFVGFADSNEKYKINLIFNKNLKTIICQIPLINDKLKKILDGRTTYHYVLIGAYSPYNSGNFLTVSKKSTLTKGGGANTKLTPRIYDYLQPEDISQTIILSSYNNNSYKYATVFPVKISKNEKKHYIKSTQLIKKFEKLSKQEQNNYLNNLKKQLSKLKKKNLISIETGIIYFELGNLDNAKKIFKSLIKMKKNEAISLAYLGSIYAIESGRIKSINGKVEGVLKSYKIFNEALKKTKSKKDLLYIYLNRGSVSLSVPDEVFHKLKLAENDFKNIIEIINVYGNTLNIDRKLKTKFLMYAYLNLAKVYEKTKNKTLEWIYYNKLKEMNDIDASIKLILIKKGILTEY